MDYGTLMLTTDHILKHKAPQLDFHGRRVAENVSRLIHIVEPKISTEHSELIYYGAALHDIGKMFIPDALLHIPRKYTTFEFEQMKGHVTMGHKLAHDLNLHPFIHDIILYHHENVDGTGYLRGRKSNEVPWYVRIVRVCDVWDALTSERSYRAALDHRTAKKILRDGKNTLFDGLYVDLLLELV